MLLMLKDAGFSPDLWSYAAILRCMGHRDQDIHSIQRCGAAGLCWVDPPPWGPAPLNAELHHHPLHCLRCLKQMKGEGFQPQLLFTELVLEEEDRAMLLRAVVKAEPAFSPPPQAPNPVNTCTLLKEVYARVSEPHLLSPCIRKAELQAHGRLILPQMSPCKSISSRLSCHGSPYDDLLCLAQSLQ